MGLAKERERCLAGKTGETERVRKGKVVYTVAGGEEKTLTHRCEAAGTDTQ